MSLDERIFGEKTLSNLFEEIYDISRKKEEQIKAIIKSLQPLIQDDIGNATLIVPLMKDWMELSIKNDEQLIKIAGIIQRGFSSKGGDDGSAFDLTEAEKEQLLKEISKIDDKSDGDNS